MRVRATQSGFYANVYRSEGDVFDLVPNPGMSVAHQFSWKWMQEVDKNTPLRSATGREQASDGAESTSPEPAVGDSRPTGDMEVI